MKDTRLVIPKSDLEIIIAKFYHLKDVSIDTFHVDFNMRVTELVVMANYPKKRRKK